MKLTTFAEIPAAVLLAAIGCARAEPIEIYGNSAQEPKAWVDPASGKLSGYVVDTADAILNDAGIDHVFKGMPFPRALDATRDCRGLMVGVFFTDERAKHLAYSAPIVADRVAVVSKAGAPSTFTSVADLHGKRVTYLRGGFTGVDLPSIPGIKLHEQVSADTMLKLVAGGRVDFALLAPIEGVAVAARTAGLPLSEFQIASNPVAVVPNHIVACKDPRFGSILKRIDASVAKLRANGALDSIMKRYAR